MGKRRPCRVRPSRLESVNHMLNDVGIRYWGEIKGQNEFDNERSNELTPKRIDKYQSTLDDVQSARTIILAFTLFE